MSYAYVSIKPTLVIIIPKNEIFMNGPFSFRGEYVPFALIYYTSSLFINIRAAIHLRLYKPALKALKPLNANVLIYLSQESLRHAVAPVATEAAWNLGRWDEMGDYAQVVSEKQIEHSFYRAVLSVHASNYEESQHFIDKTRDMLHTELSVLLQESYDRAYQTVVTVQQLAELEEIMLWKQQSVAQSSS